MDGRIPTFTLGERIQKARRDAGLSQKELGDLIGVAQNTIGNWENGKLETPVNRRKLHLIAKETGVSLQWLEHGYGNLDLTEVATHGYGAGYTAEQLSLPLLLIAA